jgi:hypothetical protein
MRKLFEDLRLRVESFVEQRDHLTLVAGLPAIRPGSRVFSWVSSRPKSREQTFASSATESRVGDVRSAVQPTFAHSKSISVMPGSTDW